MTRPSYIDNANPAFVEELYAQYRANPDSVNEGWRRFFEGFEYGCERADSGSSYSDDKQVKIMKLINAYRARGHLVAKTNPVRPRRLHPADLNLEYFGLSDADLDTEFDIGAEVRLGRTTLRKIIAHLEKVYCSSIAVEYRYTPSSQIRQWLHEALEGSGNRTQFSTGEKKQIFTKLAQATGLERFLHIKYVGEKRFSLEGLDAVIPGLDALFNEGAKLGVCEFVMGMAHRGRLNVLINLFGKKFESLVKEFEKRALPEDVGGDGDVKYHMGHSADIFTPEGNKLHISLAANPSHLEAVNPVVLGSVRAKYETLYERNHNKIVPVLLHGDAAIAGQGIIYECVNFAKLDGYAPGGIIHVITNNQVGFTANYRESRSSLYCTDIAKVLNSPVFHVNADDPEAVVHCFLLAIRLRQKFGIDVYLDVIGYRRHGHNEGDEPRFTQPMLYRNIDAHKAVLESYSERLAAEGSVRADETAAIIAGYEASLQESLSAARADTKQKLDVNFLGRQWHGLRKSKQEDFERSPDTGINKTLLKHIASTIGTVPQGFNILPKLRKVVEARTQTFDNGKVDWALAEQLAFGSLLTEGHSVRISGQDSRRGTFSHRHSYLIDEKDETEYVALNHLQAGQAQYQAYNSHLSEYGVLGFEHGYTIAMPQSLVVWEGQFGDFANGAQIIIDQFISSSESKWQRMSGLCMFLPHGYEGQGPEHSSARLERFLQLCAENNMCVANVTTPANLFHLLRRQLKVKYRIPLVLMTPKSLLRHPECVSTVDELVNGRFQEIIDDAEMTDAKKAERVILCSGKIYYELLEKKRKEGFGNVAIVRIEQFYPTPKEQDKALFERYGACKDLVWVQEEPRNMGPWYYMRARFDPLVQGLKVVARKKSASTAHGSSKHEVLLQKGLIDEAFAGISPKKA